MEAGQGTLVHLHGAGGCGSRRATTCWLATSAWWPSRCPGSASRPRTRGPGACRSSRRPWLRPVQALGLGPSTSWAPRSAARPPCGSRSRRRSACSPWCWRRPRRSARRRRAAVGIARKRWRGGSTRIGAAPRDPVPDPAVRAKTQRLVARLRGPNRDAELESRLPGLATPTLVLFGTADRVIAPAMGHRLQDADTRLPSRVRLRRRARHQHPIGRAFTEVVVDFSNATTRS